MNLAKVKVTEFASLPTLYSFTMKIYGDRIHRHLLNVGFHWFDLCRDEVAWPWPSRSDSIPGESKPCSESKCSRLPPAPLLHWRPRQNRREFWVEVLLWWLCWVTISRTFIGMLVELPEIYLMVDRMTRIRKQSKVRVGSLPWSDFSRRLRIMRSRNSSPASAGTPPLARQKILIWCMYSSTARLPLRRDWQEVIRSIFSSKSEE